MGCPKCEGKGFIEQEHGLVRVFCDCEKGKELEAEIRGEKPRYYTEEEIDDSNSGSESINIAVGSKDTGKPKKPRKPKARKGATKKSH